ncbi:hypothetical protein AB4089_13915 [Arthrobacter sp. 2MCAF15]|uniref:hypothetical protein n=1 Tax=Arthrobacter sp. 2MCAF15 TaxID=3232984 RepID=UPI003F8DC107
MFHPGLGVGAAQGPDPIQRHRDDARGPGGDLPGRDGGGELRVRGRCLASGEPGPGQQPSARDSRRLASAAPIRSRARRNSTVFRNPSSAAAPASPASPAAVTDPERAPSPATDKQAASAVPAAGVPAGSDAPDGPVSQPAGLSRQPVVHDVAAPAAEAAAAAVDSFLVRSTAAAATSCRYSAVREISSTRPAKSDAARKPHDAASSPAVALTARSTARAPSIPSTPPKHSTLHAPSAPEGRAGSKPSPASPQGASPHAMKSLVASIT